MLKNELQAEVDRLGPWHYCHQFPCGVVTGTSPPDMIQEKIAWLLSLGVFSRPVYPRVLDLGANSGLISMWFVDNKDSNVVAVEGGPKYYPQLEFAIEQKGYQERIEPVFEDITKSTARFTPDFDLVLLLGVMHHLNSDFHLDVLKRCRSALLPGGEIVVQTKTELLVLDLLEQAGFILTSSLGEMPDHDRSAWRGIKDAMKI